MSDQRYPLQWPSGWARATYRSRAAFRKGNGVNARALEVGDGLRRLQAELRRLGATQVVISSNLRLNQDGSINAGQAKMLSDPGVAAYFKLKGKPRVLACDKWLSAAENMAAIAGHIEAIRAQDRYGVGTVDQAFAGYTALPAQAASWFVVLEFNEPPRSWEIVEARYKSLARVHHPDAGGSHDTMAKITAAYQTAKSEYVGATHQ